MFVALFVTFTRFNFKNSLTLKLVQSEEPLKLELTVLCSSTVVTNRHIFTLCTLRYQLIYTLHPFCLLSVVLIASN